MPCGRRSDDRVAILAALAAPCLPSALRAASPQRRADELKAEEKAQFDKRMFGKEPAPKAKTYACFVRRYDADHLARHPHQKVTRMKLLFTSECSRATPSSSATFALG